MSKTTSQITSQQCRKARALLHWNIQDIASRCTIARARIEQFERGDLKLMRPENEALLQLLTKQGIIILANGDIDLRADNKKQSHGVTRDNNRYALDETGQEAVSTSYAYELDGSEDEQRKKKIHPPKTA